MLKPDRVSLRSTCVANAEALAAALGVSLPLASLLVQRGLRSAESARSFLHDEDDKAHDPAGLRDMPAAVATLRAAIENGDLIAIHGDYDPNADYAVEARAQEAAAAAAAQAQVQGIQPAAPDYASTGTFNRFTGRWQAADQNPDRHGDEAKSKRQMNAYFDVDAAANSHGGKSLKAERQSKKLSKAELKAFKEKRRGKKEEKRRAWLLD